MEKEKTEAKRPAAFVLVSLAYDRFDKQNI